MRATDSGPKAITASSTDGTYLRISADFDIFSNAICTTADSCGPKMPLGTDLRVPLNGDVFAIVSSAANACTHVRG